MKKNTLAILLVAALLATSAFGQEHPRHNENKTMKLSCVSPGYLKAGDRVALVSPSYYVAMEKVEKAAEVLRSWGLEPVIGPNVGKIYAGKYAGTVEERVSDLRWALNDTSIKAIICNRGGYGTIQYIDQIPFSEWAAHPKWLVGFSDITTLHGLLTRAGVMSIHGTMSSFLANGGTDQTSTLLRDLLMGSVPSYDLPAHPQNIVGKASGILVGGNICTFVPNLGTQADATLGQDIILFVEEVGESMHNIDRQFQILAHNGVLDRCKGVVLGEFSDCGKEFSYESVEAMLNERLAKYNIPLLCGFPGGHGDTNLPVIMGAPVTIDVRSDGATLTFNINGGQQALESVTMLTSQSAIAATNPTEREIIGKAYTVASPDGRLVTNITAGKDGRMAYEIVFDGNLLLQKSEINLNRDGVETLFVRKTTRRTIDENVESPFYHQSSIRNHCNELTFKLKGDLRIVFRAYNEGIAYRFVWDGKPGKVLKETVEYQFPDDWTATAPYVISFDSVHHEIQYSTSFENHYTTKSLSQFDPRRLCFLPLMVHGPDGVKICLTESSLCDYPGLYLHSTGQSELIGEHAPLPKRVEQGGHNNLQLIVKEREDYIAEMDKTKHFPWRIMMVGKNSSEIAMNNMSYLLGEPSRVEDVSWIKPGKVAWDWWNNWNIGGVDFKAGINNDTYKHYINFASKYGIEYVILDEGWAVNKQADLFQVVPEIDLPMLVNYAKERNVGIILWAGYHAFDRDMERVCKHYSEMGVKGFKVDFMDRDDQIVTDFYRRTAEMCAKYHLVVDFHGAFKPAGFNRTYPNILNFEGVFGLEQMRWTGIDWDQMRYDCEIPFIRQAAGPMDYTQGAMLNGCRNSFRPCWNEPMSQGTRCHQLALYIVLESPLNMLCDSPTNYEKEPDYTRFVASLPTVWDETRVLQGEVGEYIVTARRKGNTWYIGGITNWEARDIKVDLSRLGVNATSAELYADGANAHRRGADYKYEKLRVNDSKINVHLAPGGGFVMKITIE